MRLWRVFDLCRPREKRIDGWVLGREICPANVGHPGVNSGSTRPDARPHQPVEMGGPGKRPINLSTESTPSAMITNCRCLVNLPPGENTICTTRPSLTDSFKIKVTLL